MAFDFKKEYKEFYMPSGKPTIVDIPSANFLAIRGKGDPNEENGEYQTTLGKLYAVAYTLKMSYKSDYKIEGFYEYVVPPLEGFWWQEGICGVDYNNKATFNWVSLLRLPDFIQKKDFDWAIETAEKKKKLTLSNVEFFTYNEGLCVQCMHIGTYDDEPKTLNLMNEFIESKGYVTDITTERFHHEIYLSDPRKADVPKMKIVLRHPVKKI